VRLIEFAQRCFVVFHFGYSLDTKHNDG
jgi:hypothetical protein